MGGLQLDHTTHAPKSSTERNEQYDEQSTPLVSHDAAVSDEASLDTMQKTPQPRLSPALVDQMRLSCSSGSMKLSPAMNSSLAEDNSSHTSSRRRNRKSRMHEQDFVPDPIAEAARDMAAIEAAREKVELNQISEEEFAAIEQVLLRARITDSCGELLPDANGSDLSPASRSGWHLNLAPWTWW